MSQYLIQDTTLTAIADSVRAKAGTSDPILVSSLPDAIAAIPTTGSGENDYDYTQLQSATITMPTVTSKVDLSDYLDGTEKITFLRFTGNCAAASANTLYRVGIYRCTDESNIQRFDSVSVSTSASVTIYNDDYFAISNTLNILQGMITTGVYHGIAQFQSVTLYYYPKAKEEV